jgi:superfamily II DNA or RNA helicase
MKVRIEHHKTFIEEWESDNEQEKVLKHLKLIYTRREGKRVFYDHTHNLYNKEDRSFPSGYIDQLAKELEKYNIDIEGVDHRRYPKGTVHLTYKIKEEDEPEAREIQQETLKRIKTHPVGMINGAAGTGKSRISRMIVDYYRVRTLVVVPTTKIQKQMYEMFCLEYGSNSVAMTLKTPGSYEKQTLGKKLKVTNKYKPRNVDINQDMVDDGLSPEDKYLNEKGFELINGKMVKVRRAIDGKSAKTHEAKYPAILVICFQSLNNIPLEYLSSVEMLIVDEGHTARNNTIQAAASEMTNAAYRYFLSATNWADIKEDMKKLIATTGSQLIHEELPIDSIAKGIIKTPSMRIVNTKNTDKKLKFVKGDNLIKLGIVGNAERNTQICDLAKELMETEGRRIMICVWEDSHAMVLQERFRKMGIESYMYFSKLDDKEKIAVDEIASNSKTAFVAICTVALGIGADTRSVDTIILADVRKATIGLLQRIGRGHRVPDDILSLWIYDFKDGFNDKTYEWHKSRQKTFTDYYYKNESFAKNKASKFGILIKED